MDIPALQSLTLAYNHVSDLRPLMGLTSIRTLDVSYNSVSSTVPLGSLSSLQELNLAGNGVSNFTGLSKLSSLNTLNISSTGFSDTDIDQLINLMQLRTLNVENNAGFTGTGYDRLRQYLPGCNIVHSDLVYSIPAQTFTIQTDTTDLDLSDRGVSDLSFLMQMNNLNTLRMAGNGISSISPFQYTESWRTLTVLDLSRNSIIDPTPLTGLVNLTSLDLSYNQITNRLEDIRVVSPLQTRYQELARIEAGVEKYWKDRFQGNSLGLSYSYDKSYQRSSERERRQYKVMKSIYMLKSKKTVRELAEEYSVTDRTIQKDREIAEERLSVLFFGIDGLRFSDG